jgi:hypothetical protein
MLAAAWAVVPVGPVPEPRCAITDPRLTELSGLVVGDGVWAVADGGRRTEVHRLDDDCAVTETRTAEIDPYDSEDLARGPDGELWVADIGDNQRRRDTVAVIVLPARGKSRLHRLTYPDGPHDAEALLVDDAGVPHLVTKDAGSAGVYRTGGPPDGPGPTPLVHVGDVVPPASDTVGGPLGAVGPRVFTGAATSADGRVVALRTYTDAWLYPVDDGDVAAALRTDPVRVPLPDEPQGEAVAFEADGTLLSASEARRGRPGELRAVPGAVELVGAAATTTTPAAGPGPGRPAWFPAAVAGTGGVGLLVLVGAALAWRARRR